MSCQRCLQILIICTMLVSSTSGTAEGLPWVNYDIEIWVSNYRIRAQGTLRI